MSNLDEARYGRACLLVLNICPFTLRQVIEDYYKRHGSLSIQDFLEKNKHALFHLLRKRCCCRSQQSTTTPMFSSQWNSLFMKNSSTCLKCQRGDCPCQYDAKPGITTSVMDITLCFLVIKNICPGITINMTHIDTIRDVRNHLIHAGSASLDEPTYLLYWSKVENAIIDLAHHVSPALMIDTNNMVKDLETQVMNMAELAKEIKRLMLVEKRIQDLGKNVAEIEDNMNEKMLDVEEHVGHTIQKTAEIEESVSQTIQKTAEIEESVSQTIQKTAEIEESVSQTIQNIIGIDERVNQNTQNLKETKSDISLLITAVEDQRQEFELLKDEKVKPRAEVSSEDHRQEFKLLRYEKVEPRTEVSSGKFQNIKKLRQRLIEISNNITHVIPISPLQKRGENEIPLELLYASVVIREDHKYAKKYNISAPLRTKTKFHSIKTFFKRLSGRGSSSHGDSMAVKKTREVTDPDDLFLIDGKIARNIYMLGDAAHGKTTYCMWLLKKWCNAQQMGGMEKKTLDKWEAAMKKYDFVFLLKFRNVNPSRASVIDMICQDVFPRDPGYHASIRRVLSSDKYRSLIIMDGLDEWNPNEESSKCLTFKGLPNMDGMASSVSCFISMRPWVFPVILEMMEVNDRVIEIHGLSETGMERVIENVLLNRYKLEKKSSQYIDIHKRLVRYIADKSLKSFMQIPLLAVVCVQIWYNGEQVGDSMTSFYTAMLNMLIERAQLKHETQQSCFQTTTLSLPKLLSAKKNIKCCINVLIKLGKVAFEGLLSKQRKLVFQADKLEEEIGEREIQFALDVGLISQKETSSLTTKNVSVHFFHKSIQEFLAAIYIVTQKDVSDSFCEHLSNVKFIMELSNVIMFLCGMCPSLGSVISQRVVSVTDNDTAICRYRESPGYGGTVKELYKLQISWYRELKYGQTDSQVTNADSPVTHTDSALTQTDRAVTQTDYSVTQIDSQVTHTDSQVTKTDSALTQNDSTVTQTDRPVTQTDRPVIQTDIPVTQADIPVTRTDSSVTFHVSDVYLDGESDTETVTVTRELLSDHHVDVRSLWLGDMPTDGECSITDSVLDDFLSNSHNRRSLVKLCIYGSKTRRSVSTLCVPTLRCLFLDNVTITTHLCGNVCSPLLTDMSQLRVLVLWNVTLGKGGLGLSPDMIHIKMIKLVRMTLGEGGLGRLSLDMVQIKLVELLRVEMPAAAWGNFVRSVSHIQHRFDVLIHETNIDAESVAMIRRKMKFGALH